MAATIHHAPRLVEGTTTERTTTYANPGSDARLIYWDTDLETLLFWDGTEWIPMFSSKAGTISGFVRLGGATDYTISSGSVTILNLRAVVDTEGAAASDDLDTVLGGGDNDMIHMMAKNTSRTVVIKHGTGNIYTNTGADITLDETYKIATLVYGGTYWWASL